MSDARKFTLSRAQSGAEMGAYARNAKGEHLIRYGDTIEVVEVARVRELEAALTDAIELADEGWVYASPYFIAKWQFAERIAALQAALHPAPTDEDKP